MSDDPTLRAEILAAAVLHGDFVLHSGQHSSYYVDKYRFQVRPALLRRVAAQMAEHIPQGTQRLAGVELGAVPLVTATSLHTGIPFVIVRKGAKDYATAKLIEGEPLDGAVVTLLEDVLTTGKAALDAAAKIVEAGGQLARIVAVFDRGDGCARLCAAGYRAEALFTVSERELEEAAQ